jgi:hypothetical protein
MTWPDSAGALQAYPIIGQGNLPQHYGILQ